MKALKLDTGIREYKINNGVLRFNPSDPNVYARFFEAAKQIQAIEKDLVAKGEALQTKENVGEDVIHLMTDADKQIKDLLGQVFGPGNDFDQMLGGVNLMAVACNGERVITNLLQALSPILEQGAQNCANQRVDDAVALAKKNRAARRAKQ